MNINKYLLASGITVATALSLLGSGYVPVGNNVTITAQADSIVSYQDFLNDCQAFQTALAMASPYMDDSVLETITEFKDDPGPLATYQGTDGRSDFPDVIDNYSYSFNNEDNESQYNQDYNSIMSLYNHFNSRLSQADQATLQSDLAKATNTKSWNSKAGLMANFADDFSSAMTNYGNTITKVQKGSSNTNSSQTSTISPSSNSSSANAQPTSNNSATGNNDSTTPNPQNSSSTSSNPIEYKTVSNKMKHPKSLAKKKYNQKNVMFDKKSVYNRTKKTTSFGQALKNVVHNGISGLQEKKTLTYDVFLPIGSYNKFAKYLPEPAEYKNNVALEMVDSLTSAASTISGIDADTKEKLSLMSDVEKNDIVSMIKKVS